MRIRPDYCLSVLREEEYNEKMPAISQALEECRQTGTFSGFDGKPLYYEYFLAEESRGAVVVAHGLSEFSEKYHEFAWYLLHQGYDVFLYDQRCHGRSCRLTDRQDLIHVDHFSHYRKDLHRFVCDVVRTVTDKPLYLYSHSMGGAVAAQYLAEHPETFQKAVLSAPMILPLTGGVPAFVARWGLLCSHALGFGKRKFRFSSEFNPEYPFAKSRDRSFARFQRNMELRLANEAFRTTPLSVRWVQQSVSLRGKLTSRRFLRKIKTPILMLCAENDGVVHEKPQAIFARRCPACRQEILPGSTHSMLCGTYETISTHVQMVLHHFS